MVTRDAPQRTTGDLIASIAGRVPMRNLHSLVLWQLGVAIVGGDYPEGSILPSDTELLARFSVSRTVLREALKTLTAGTETESTLTQEVQMVLKRLGRTERR